MKNLLKRLLPSFFISWYHFSWALASAVLYGFPSRKLKVIGITGTNGKSTVAELTLKVLEGAGFKCALLSSIRFKVGDKEWANKLKMTMPGRFFIQKLLREAVSQGCQYAIMEVTSEGIKQHRHRFINFEAAVFTNLTPEHIESHGGFENYKKAKGKLFSVVNKIHIINIDDEHAEYFMGFSADKIITYGLDQGDISNKNIQISLQLPGQFNIYNALAAIAVGLSQNIDLDVCKKMVESLSGILGRMEEVISEPFKVIVDYAFTPNALEQVYKTISGGLQKDSKMVCVLGACGGGRDKWKRPVLGKIASQYCSKVIVTNEDPYDEDPLSIMEQVVKGFTKDTDHEEILDRREAIKRALVVSKPQDVVIITGKGSEPWICMANGRKIAWDDKEIAREELKKLTQ